MEDEDNCEFCHLAYLTLVCRTEGLFMTSGQSDRFLGMASICRYHFSKSPANLDPLISVNPDISMSKEKRPFEVI